MLNAKRVLLTVLIGGSLVGAPSPLAAQDPVAALESALAGRYEVAMKEVLPQLLEAQATILTARGRKEDAAGLRLTAQQSISAAGKIDPKVQESVLKAVSQSARDIADSLNASTDILQKEARDTMIAGVGQFGSGLVMTADWASSLSNLQAAVEGLSSVRNPMQLRKANSLMDSAKGLLVAAPQLVAGNAAMVTAIKAYAAKIKLDLPAGALSDDFKNP